MTKANSLRVFIYMDVAKLYSLYSQVFEGITDQVIEERIKQLVTGDTQSSMLRQTAAESWGMESSRRIESGILHDHMYDRLERELGSSVVNAADVELDDLVNALTLNPMIRISGRSEIEDYQRISAFFEHFNTLGEAIAYAGIAGSPEIRQKRQALETELEAAPGKARRQQIQRQITQLTDAKPLAAERGLVQDPQLLKNLRFMGELFNPDGYDIVITRKDKPNVHFRGVLDKVWLRSDPQLIRSLYGGQSEAPWSMVGIATHLPGTYVPLTDSASPTQQSNVLSKQTDEAQPMLLDAYRNMFRTARAFERMFLESNTDIEIVVSPLAIYREFRLQIKGEDHE